MCRVYSVLFVSVLLALAMCLSTAQVLEEKDSTVLLEYGIRDLKTNDYIWRVDLSKNHRHHHHDARAPSPHSHSHHHDHDHHHHGHRHKAPPPHHHMLHHPKAIECNIYLLLVDGRLIKLMRLNWFICF